MSKTSASQSGNADIFTQLIQDFSVDQAVNWVHSKFSSFDSTSRGQIPLSSTKKNEQVYFSKIERLGYVTNLILNKKTSEINKPLLVAAIEMKKELSERTSRLVQFNCAKRLLQEAVETPLVALSGLPTQGLFFFYDSYGRFRISLVTGQAENRRFKLNQAKRQSFFIVPDAANRTVKHRLGKKIDSYEALKEAFSVEALTKEFYDALFRWYEWAIDTDTNVLFPNDPSTKIDDRKQVAEAVIRLITRLMFVWFVRQKGIIPKELFEEDDLRSILKKFNPQSMAEDNYYRAILQNLFFATLNCLPKKRKFVHEYHGKSNERGVKTFYRYENEIRNSADFLKLMGTVPFLNCALFDCLDTTKEDNDGGKEMLLDGFSSKRNRQARVPNGLFFDEADGIINLFKRFDFTVDENSPDDEDVALDPELLGKVFENLLGVFNPETQETARKATGSFYTPREIVDYMVEQSLKNYLKTKVPTVDDARLNELFDRSKTESDSARDFSKEEKEQLQEAIYNCKILDPACGSGAFPMGALHCMVHVLSRLDPKNLTLSKRLREQYNKDSCNMIRMSQQDRDEYSKQLDERLKEGTIHPNYARKLYLIENCIYGVDVQPIAAQISKLRFFISLLCDQFNFSSFDSSKEQQGENYGLLELPNLEAKFVCANTLIPLPNVNNADAMFSIPEVQELKEELQRNRHDIFTARSAERKQKCKKKDRDIRAKIQKAVRKALVTPNEAVIAENEVLLAELTTQREAVAAPKIERKREIVGGDLFTEGTEQWVEYDLNASKRRDLDSRIDTARRIIEKEKQKAKRKLDSKIDQLAALVASWDPYNQNACSPFFDPEWMFNITNGFDIVIGNPPYIKEYTNKSAFNGFREQSPYYQGKMDLWYGFACKCIDYLQQDGVLCFIATNNWTTNAGASILRNKVISETRILQLIDFNTYMIFGKSASIQTMVMLFKKSSNLNPYSFDYRKLLKDNLSRVELLEFLRKELSDSIYQNQEITPNHSIDTILNFSDSSTENLLTKIALSSTYFYDKELAQGIVFPQDFLNRKNQSILGRFNIGDGIFVLSAEEKRCLHLLKSEMKLIKPYYTSNEIGRYYTNPNNLFWAIYTDSKFSNPLEIRPYPNIKKHLDSFKKIITSDNKPYGLHRARQEHFFRGEKIVSLRKCVGRPCFSYSDFDVYVSATFFVIQTSRFNMKFLTGLLNSTLIEFWLRHKGKMQGENFQIDKEPLLNIPIKSEKTISDKIASIVDKILAAKSADISADVSQLEAQIDQLVYQLYGLTEDEIAIVEGSATNITATPAEASTSPAPRSRSSKKKPAAHDLESEYLD